MPAFLFKWTSDSIAQFDFWLKSHYFTPALFAIKYGYGVMVAQ